MPSAVFLDPKEDAAAHQCAGETLERLFGPIGGDALERLNEDVGTRQTLIRSLPTSARAGHEQSYLQARATGAAIRTSQSKRVSSLG